MGKAKEFWKKIYRWMPKKHIFIEGNAAEELGQEEAEILEGEATPMRVYFDEACEYEIIEREIAPAKMKCPGCKRIVPHGMDYCNFCGQRLKEQNEQ